MDHPEEAFQDIIGRRLITHAGNVEHGDVKQDAGVIAPHERGEESATTEHDADAGEQRDAAASANVQAAAFAKVEKSLISLGFFTPSSRRIKSQKVKRITFTRVIDGKRVEASAEFHPSAILGLPITADQDKYLALHDIITNILQNEGKITNPIRFTSAELLRLLNKRVRTGKNYKDIYEWLDVMTATTIFSKGVVYEAGKQRFATDRFHVFERAVSVGKEMPDGSIADANYVWLSEWQLENINQNFLLPIDLFTYRQLKNHISKALVPLLQVWLFASQRAGSFEKRYDELCEILSLQIYNAPSLITRQFKPSLDELMSFGYLKEWRIEKTSDRKAYKFVLFHGPKFHQDRRRRREQKNRAEPIVIAASQSTEPTLPEPGKLDGGPLGTEAREPETEKTIQLNSLSAPESPERNTEQSSSSPETIAETDLQMSDAALQTETAPTALDELVARGVMASAAIKLLESLPGDRRAAVPDVIEYWDHLKGNSVKEIGVGLLYELIRNGGPIPAGFETKRARQTKAAAERRSERIEKASEALQRAYMSRREHEIDGYLAQLPSGEYDSLCSHHREQLLKQIDFLEGHQHGPLFDAMLGAAIRAEMSRKAGIMTFDEFCRQEGRQMISDYDLSADELVSLGVPPITDQSAPQFASE
jgi:hypothetical protein